jgi:hypothetical protein
VALWYKASWYVKEVFVKVGMQILGTDFRLVSKRIITFLIQGIACRVCACCNDFWINRQIVRCKIMKLEVTLKLL